MLRRGLRHATRCTRLRRSVHRTAPALHGHDDTPADAPTVPIHFKLKDGETMTVQAKCGMNLMRVAHAHEIDLEGERPSANDGGGGSGGNKAGQWRSSLPSRQRRTDFGAGTTSAAREL